MVKFNNVIKTEVWVSYRYGGYSSIEFAKTFDLPFAPFHGLMISDCNDEVENNVELANNDYVTTFIYWDVRGQQFHVNVREHWKRPVTDDTVDSILELFTKSGWERKDHTNIDDMKELMNRNSISK